MWPLLAVLFHLLRLILHKLNGHLNRTGFRNSLLNALDEFKKNEEGGMFINSCFIHCQTVKETWYGSSYSSKIGNKTIAETVGDWYFNRERGKRVDCPFPCNPSCLNMDFTLPGARFWETQSSLCSGCSSSATFRTHGLARFRWSHINIKLGIR